MANNNVQAQETESLNIREAFFLKYKKAIIIAVVAIIVIIAGVFGYVSQISGPREDKPSDVLSYGQVITAKVVDFNEESQKISLSMKALDTKEETEE